MSREGTEFLHGSATVREPAPESPACRYGGDAALEKRKGEADGSLRDRANSNVCAWESMRSARKADSFDRRGAIRVAGFAAPARSAAAVPPGRARWRDPFIAVDAARVCSFFELATGSRPVDRRPSSASTKQGSRISAGMISRRFLAKMLLHELSGLPIHQSRSAPVRAALRFGTFPKRFLQILVRIKRGLSAGQSGSGEGDDFEEPREHLGFFVQATISNAVEPIRCRISRWGSEVRVFVEGPSARKWREARPVVGACCKRERKMTSW